ncbi:sodium-dependent proline transporter-like [Lineus longissimus]|uniref:sodium-dependent proline transporter-like n=1 Tax=Lineus longissimus TaxID=88925 RepID=UPI002B4F0DFB
MNKQEKVSQVRVYESSTMVDSCSSSEDIIVDTSRGTWNGRFEFLLSCVGFAVGLGNIWRFPYLCMRNGGGAFLIPYFFFLFVCGIPLFIMELSIGQFASSGPTRVFNICPLFKGLGWGMVVVNVMVVLYYQTIITWTLYYLGMSFYGFADRLPWANCNNTWNTEQCRMNGTSAWINETYMNATNLTDIGIFYQSENMSTVLDNVTIVNTSKTMSPSEEFWQYNVLELTDGIETLGGFRWQLVLCHISGWVLLFVCLFKGIRSTGKVVYVTATVPYLFLTILLIRGCMMPGSLNGIKYYITPDFSKLLNLKIWAEACLQIFYSLGPAWGGMITFASYNEFHHNCYRDGIIVPLVNCFTSFYGGFVIFAVVGFMAHEAGVDVQDAMTSGPGLAFIAYPEALTKFPLASLWSVLFFLMLLTLGLDSQFACSECILSGVVDQFPEFFSRGKHRKQYLLVVFVLANILIGLLFCTRAGMYYFQIWDWFSAAFSILLIAALESMVVAWAYGSDSLLRDISCMIGYKPLLLRGFKPFWCFVIPFLMLFCLVYSAVVFITPSYGVYYFPPWAVWLGWTLSLFSTLPIPAFMIQEIMQRKGTFLQRLRQSIKPGPEWRPRLAKHRKEYDFFTANEENSPSESRSTSQESDIMFKPIEMGLVDNLK